MNLVNSLGYTSHYPKHSYCASLLPKTPRRTFKDCCLRWERWLSPGLPTPTLPTARQPGSLIHLGVLQMISIWKIILCKKKKNSKKIIIIGLKPTSLEHSLLVWASGQPFTQVAHDITRPQLFLINSASQRKIQPFYILTFLRRQPILQINQTH